MSTEAFMDKPTKDKQVMTRMTKETYSALERISKELDRSVSWLLNDLAVKFVTAHEGPKKRK
jgi:hypothetical protein